MKAMLLKQQSPIETSPLEWTEVPTPEPADNEIRIKVLACGLCRTDLHVIEGDLPPRRSPLIPGHQVVGIVEKMGAKCRRFQIGARVGIAWLRYTCGECDFCVSGKENLCPLSRYTGYDADGGYAEYAVVSENFAYEIPTLFSDTEAVALLCAGIVGYRALERSLLPDGGTLAIFGFGSSAHMIIRIALRRSCRVLVVTRDEKHRDLALQMGAAWVGEKAAEVPEPVDSAIIFAPAGELVPQALHVLKKGGTLSLAGIHMSEIPALDYDRDLFYEKNIHPVTANTREDGRRFLAEATAIPIRPRVRLYDLQDANQALRDLKEDRISGTGVLRISQT